MSKDTEINEGVGARLKAAREAHGLDHAELSEKIGYTPDVIRRAEDGRWNVSETFARRVRETLGVTL